MAVSSSTRDAAPEHARRPVCDGAWQMATGSRGRTSNHFRPRKTKGKNTLPWRGFGGLRCEAHRPAGPSPRLGSWGLGPQLTVPGGRILCVCVCPEAEGQEPILLNHLTAPHCVVWSAIAASCAFPCMFPPQVTDNTNGARGGGIYPRIGRMARGKGEYAARQIDHKNVSFPRSPLLACSVLDSALQKEKKGASVAVLVAKQPQDGPHLKQINGCRGPSVPSWHVGEQRS
eukprot:1176479-Prorocentrum_minimum.AAC.2